MPCGFLAGFAFVAIAVQPEGMTSCPAPDLVATRLAGLLPADAGAGEQPDRARMWEDGGDLVIRLERADGVVLGTRRLPRTFGCEDLAAAVAVSVAAWESDVHPEFAPVLAARNAREMAPAPHDLALAPPPSAPSIAPQTWSLGVGAALGVGGSVDAPALAGDALLDAWFSPPGARTSLRAEIEGQSARQIVLQNGRAAWRRWSLGLGVERPFFAADRHSVDGQLFSWFGLARIAWLNLRGEGFPQNHTANVLDPGVTAGLRWTRAVQHWSFGLELAASLWPVGHDAIEGENGNLARLPAGELFLRVTGARRLRDD